MLEGFKPLDLSFLRSKPLDMSMFGGSSVDGQVAPTGVPSALSVAKKISGNMDWNAAKKIADDTAKKGSPEEPTFLGGLMDLLSSGNYAVANGVEGGINAWHDRGSDGPLGWLEAAGGAVKGSLEGLGAGITSGLAAMTGLDDDTARSQYGKTRWSDIIQNHTPLGIKFDPNTGQYTQDGDVITEDQAKQRNLANGLFGLAGDIFLDPLSYTGGGLLPKFSKGAQIATDGGDAAKTVLASADDLQNIKGIGKVDASATGDINNLAQGAFNIDKYLSPINKASDAAGIIPIADKASKFATDVAPVANKTENAKSFDDMLSEMMGAGELSSAKNAETGGDVGKFLEGASSLPTSVAPVAEDAVNALKDTKYSRANSVPKNSLLFEGNQNLLASKLGGLIAAAPDAKTAVRDVFGWLGSKHSEFEFPSLESYMEKIRTAPNYNQFKGLFNYAGKEPALMQKSAELRKRVIGGLRQAIKTDVAASDAAKGSGVRSASQIIDDIAAGNDSARFSNIGKALDAQDAGVLNKMIQKYGKSIATGVFHSAKNPDAVAQAVKNGTIHKWTGPVQVNVWNSLLHNLNATGALKYTNPKSRWTKALDLLRKFEDHFIGQGHTPYSAFKTAESVPLRLSDVISHIGKEAFAKHSDDLTSVLRSAFSGGQITGKSEEAVKLVQQAIEKAKAGAAIAETPIVQGAVSKGQHLIENTMATASAVSKPAAEEVVAQAAKATKDAALNGGASLNGAKAAGEWLKDAYGIADPVGNAITSNKIATMAAMSEKAAEKGAIAIKYSNAPKVTAAIGKALGQPISQVAKKVGPLSRVEDWLGARFNAAYKNADMRPVYLSNMASAKATVSLRARQINDLVHKFGNDGNLWHEAMQAAQGMKAAGTPEIKALGQEIQKVMEDLFGGSGLRKGAEFESTVVGRSQLLMGELNQALKRFGLPFQFTNKGKYAKGADWMKSWESWDVKNPLRTLYSVQNAVEHTVRTRTMFDEIVSRFGSYAKKAGYTTQIDSKLAKEFPYLAQAHFSPEMAEQANNFLKIFKEANTPQSKFLAQINNVLSKWKSSVTIYRPAHYWRNLVGDMAFNWLANVSGTKPYNIARKVMQSQKGKYEWDTGNLADLTGPDALKKAIARGGSATGPIGSNIALTMRNGLKVTNDMLYVAAFQKGILPSARILEDLPDKVPSILDKIHLPGKMQGKGQEFVHGLHEQRDHFIRLAHFADAVMKSGKPFEQAVDDAARIVRKWHPDGMDFTKFERNTMRTVFPFYSWTRKAIPLAVESVYSNPGKVMLYPKLQYGIQQMNLGQQAGNSMADPFPLDQLWPDWMREKGIGPMFGSGPGDYSIIAPSFPINDLAAQFGNLPRMLGQGFSSKGISGITQMVNPFAKIPAEMMSGTNLINQAPIKDWSQYFTNQIPGISDAGRVTNVDLGGLSPSYDKQGGIGNMQNIINYLTGIGYTDVNPNVAKAGQFNMRDYIKRTIKDPAKLEQMRNSQ
jgi:hypothetical protein